MNNVDIVKQAYKSFSEGNIEAVLSVFDSEIVWEESTGFPYVKNDGIFRGQNEIVENVFANIPKYYEDFMIHINELFGTEDKVVMAGHYGGVWKETGKRFMANATHVWTLNNGKVTHFFQVSDTAAIMNP
jgi:uncharacterized protein